MRPITTRSILCAATVFAAACGSEVSDSPTSPTGVRQAAAPTLARGATQLPFRGSLTTEADLVPPNPNAVLSGVGHVTHLGQMTVAMTAIVDFATSTATGSFKFTAANGDELSGTFIGIEGIFVGENVARITEVATVTSGTGRFQGASGTFTIVRFDTINFATGHSTGTATIAGHINLGK
jgi:hypothetical protein